MENVWYRSIAALNIPPWEDHGTLTISNGKFWFNGRNRCTGRILGVHRAWMGLNRWVLVRYDNGGEPRDAYFMNGALLGWVGVLGGNKRLAAEFEAAQDNPPPFRGA